LVDVVVQDGEDIAFLPFIKPGHALLLHVVERVQAELVLHGLSQVPPQHAVKILKHRFQTPNGEGQHREGHELVPRVNNPKTGKR
jgi:hypothetical protein